GRTWVGVRFAVMVSSPSRIRVLPGFLMSLSYLVIPRKSSPGGRSTSLPPGPADQAGWISTTEKRRKGVGTARSCVEAYCFAVLVALAKEAAFEKRISSPVRVSSSITAAVGIRFALDLNSKVLPEAVGAVV